MPLRAWFLPSISGIIYIIAGVSILLIQSNTYIALTILPGFAFIISGLTILSFTLFNHKAINGWGWYMVYGMLILDMGIYLLIYTGDSILFYIGFISLLRSIILLGTAIDLKRYQHQNWGKIAIASMAGILFSAILLAGLSSPDDSTRLIIAAIFTATGISSIFLSVELKKVNIFYKRLRKLVNPK
jgi:uncharacterized membrane protein HdeD (DUF308 family)